MIRNYSKLLRDIYKIMETDQAATMKITFNDLYEASDFTDDYLSTVIDPAYYFLYADIVIITLTAEVGSYTATLALLKILSTAAQDYNAKKIQLI